MELNSDLLLLRLFRGYICGIYKNVKHKLNYAEIIRYITLENLGKSHEGRGTGQEEGGGGEKGCIGYFWLRQGAVEEAILSVCHFPQIMSSSSKQASNQAAST